MLRDRCSFLLIAALLLAGAIPELLTMGFSPLTPYLVKDFALTEAHVGLLGASMGAGSLVLSVAAGQFVDVRGPRAVLMAGTFLSALSFVAFSVARSFLPLFSVLFLAGAFRPFSDIASTKATMLEVPPAQQTTAVGMVHVGPSLSSVVTAALFPLLATAVGWRTGLQLFAAALLPVGWWLWRIFSGTRFRAMTGGVRFSRLSRILRFPEFWKCMVVWGGFMSGNFAFLTFFILHLTLVVGMSPGRAGALLALAQVVAVIGRPLWGVISDRCFGGARVPAAVIMGVMGTAAFCGLALVSADSPALIPALIAVVAGASIMSSRPIGTTLALEYVPVESGGRALALLSLVTWTVAMVLPPVLGWLITRTGSWTGAWVISAVVIGSTLPALLSLSPASDRPRD